MHLILLSGGSGKRLWPLSNDLRSKQFLKIIDNNGKLESMLQRVWRQLKELDLTDSTIIATSKSQKEIIHNQIGNNVQLIIEPERRDTFPAIALASSFLYSIKNASLNDIVVILPVDPYVEISFFKKIMDLEKVLEKTNADLALMGVKPTYPSEKYGYIVPKNNNNENFFEVSHFKEKPNKEQAEDLIKNNALWNCGVFAFRLSYLISLLKSKKIPTSYEELLNEYPNLEKISFDYEVVEKTKNIVAITYDGYWKDLGTWNTLTEEMGTNIVGNGKITSDSINTHLINELDIPVTVIGIKNAVIAASPDGILVSDKQLSHKVKDLLHDYNQHPMYEEKSWGYYKILDYSKEGEFETITKKVLVKAGESLIYHKHLKRDEVWAIIKGKGELILNNNHRFINSGDIIIIPKKSNHTIKAITDIELIEIQSGKDLYSEDFIEINISWEKLIERYSTILKKSKIY